MYKASLKILSNSPVSRGLSRLFFGGDYPELRREVMDLDFRTPVGIAAGFDTSGEFYNALTCLSCGFEIIGPATSSTRGVTRAIVARLKEHRPKDIVVGLNITKETYNTTEDDIQKIYLETFAYAYDFVDMSVLNFGNETIGSVQELAFVKGITDPVLSTRLSYDVYKPVLLRLFRSLKEEELFPILDYCLMNGIDGVLCEGTRLVSQVRDFSKGRLPVIAVADIKNVEDSGEFFKAGASLLALDNPVSSFTPGLPKSILKTLKKK